ncbi:MAG: hypothetical protein C0406_01325 [Sideroxydans sp.]|nr:hypothetical protein [Sideroxydans sp.]
MASSVSSRNATQEEALANLASLMISNTLTKKTISPITTNKIGAKGKMNKAEKENKQVTEMKKVR